MSFPSKDGPNSYIWKIKDVYNARLGDNWPGSGGSLGLFAGGISPAQTNVIAQINIKSAANATDFGDLIGTANKNIGSMGSSFTRGVFAGGHTDGSYTAGVNVVQYVEFATTGNAADFGDSTYSAERRASSSGGSDSTRGISYGGFTFQPSDVFYNIIDYITFASTGNSIDFGDMTVSALARAQCGSNTRGVAAGGLSNSSTFRNNIDFITIQSTGNATDFGDLNATVAGLAGASSSTRGTFAGGFTPTTVNTIDFITIASTGNATDFGDLTTANNGLAGVSNGSRGVFGGGSAPTIVNTIQFITIDTTGNATDFGDLIAATSGLAGSSNGHGGLQ
jgi:hypothetical protein|tara:strand:+ start:6632 stop:7639 length:1008 start_codon:yes stop_codon:yes gene_type:complete